MDKLNYSDNDTSVLNASPHCTAHPQVWERSAENSVTYERSIDIWPTYSFIQKIFKEQYPYERKQQH